MTVSFDLDDDTVNAAADGALARMPTAQDGFQGPNSEGADATPSASIDSGNATPSSGDLDDSGAAWDSKIHATGRDGKGVKTASGTWRKKRQSRVGGTRAATAEAPKPGAPVVLTEEQKANAMQCGIVVAECIFQSCQAFGGAEWAPRVKPVDERANMQGAWGAYFVAKGVTDMPPSLILLVALGGYMIPRFTDPKEFPDTRTRVQKIREWVGVRIDRFKQRREAAKNRAGATKEIDVEKSNADA